MPVNVNGGLKAALAQSDPLIKVQVFIVSGRQYCFYFEGWNGRGWYRCGYAFGSGVGWGGAYGWRGWRHGQAERRFGHGHRGGDVGASGVVSLTVAGTKVVAE